MTPSLLHNEEELLLKFRGGDGSAFETIYNSNYVSVFYFTRRFITDTQAAEDITTEVFLKLWNGRAGFHNMPSLRSFLYVTARNACLNHIRSNQRQLANLQTLAYLQAGDELPENEDISTAMYQYIYDEIEKLPEQPKKVFLMSYLEGLPNEEIASRLNINNQSVRNHKARALKALRLAFADINMSMMFVALFSYVK